MGNFHIKTTWKKPNFPSKSLNFGRVLLPGNPHPALAALTRRKSFQIHLSSWGFLASPHAVVPSGAKESCGREASCSHPMSSQHRDGLFQDPASLFPTKVRKIQDFSLRKPFHALKGVIFPPSQILFCI